MNPEAMIKKARAADFVANNGKVLRGINMLRIDYNKLSSIRVALGIDADEYADSVNYLRTYGAHDVVGNGSDRYPFEKCIGRSQRYVPPRPRHPN